MKHKSSLFPFQPSALVVAIASTLIVANSQAADEDIFFSELPVVASVSRLPQPLSEAPGAVTVIDRDMIRTSGARNFADLLRLVPGFQVTPPNQDSAVVSYHGLSNEEYTPRVQVLIDGRSQYSPLFKSGVNWNLLPVVLENIDRIEVMRGSNTVSYGSNAYLGVVNIITLDASQTQGWMLAANHGNASVRDETIRWGGKAANADVRMTYRQLSDDGFRKMFEAAWAGLIHTIADITACSMCGLICRSMTVMNCTSHSAMSKKSRSLAAPKVLATHSVILAKTVRHSVLSGIAHWVAARKSNCAIHTLRIGRQAPITRPFHTTTCSTRKSVTTT